MSESLIFLASEARCSIDLCKEMRWKLLFQRSGFVGVLRLYESKILMIVSLTCIGLILEYLCKYIKFRFKKEK